MDQGNTTDHPGDAQHTFFMWHLLGAESYSPPASIGSFMGYSYGVMPEHWNLGGADYAEFYGNGHLREYGDNVGKARGDALRESWVYNALYKTIIER